jgi:hypothetical protein
LVGLDLLKYQRRARKEAIKITTACGILTLYSVMVVVVVMCERDQRGNRWMAMRGAGVFEPRREGRQAMGEQAV